MSITWRRNWLGTVLFFFIIASLTPTRVALLCRSAIRVHINQPNQHISYQGRLSFIIASKVAVIPRRTFSTRFSVRYLTIKFRTILSTRNIWPNASSRMLFIFHWCHIHIVITTYHRTYEKHTYIQNNQYTIFAWMFRGKYNPYTVYIYSFWGKYNQ